MFTFEQQGYKREEVENYISKLKAELIQYKLGILKSEQKVLDLKQKEEELNEKENKINKAVKTLEKAQKMQEEGAKNLTALKSEQSKILINKIGEFFTELKLRCPQISIDEELSSKMKEVESLIAKIKINLRENIAYNENDPMRALLNRMQAYKKEQGEVKVVKIERNTIEKNLGGSVGVDEFLAENPQSNELYKNVEIQSSGFDLKEAVNPKDDLEEIMKAFDFFNE